MASPPTCPCPSEVAETSGTQSMLDFAVGIFWQLLDRLLLAVFPQEWRLLLDIELSGTCSGHVFVEYVYN